MTPLEVLLLVLAVGQFLLVGCLVSVALTLRGLRATLAAQGFALTLKLPLPPAAYLREALIRYRVADAAARNLNEDPVTKARTEAHRAELSREQP